MFIAALFVIAKKWKQPKMPPTDERINRIYYNHPMEICLIINSNDVLTHDTTWMNLENVGLKEASQ